MQELGNFFADLNFVFHGSGCELLNALIWKNYLPVSDFVTLQFLGFYIFNFFSFHRRCASTASAL